MVQERSYVFSIRQPPSLIAALDHLAKKLDVSRNALIREAIEDLLEKYEEIRIIQVI